MTLLGTVSSVQNPFFSSMTLPITNAIPLYNAKNKILAFSKNAYWNGNIFPEHLKNMMNEEEFDSFAILQFFAKIAKVGAHEKFWNIQFAKINSHEKNHFYEI